MPVIRLGACGASGEAHRHPGREAAAQLMSKWRNPNRRGVPLRADQASTRTDMIRQSVPRNAQGLLCTSASSMV
jgi:hypothetical protein